MAQQQISGQFKLQFFYSNLFKVGYDILKEIFLVFILIN